MRNRLETSGEIETLVPPEFVERLGQPLALGRGLRVDDRDRRIAKAAGAEQIADCGLAPEQRDLGHTFARGPHSSLQHARVLALGQDDAARVTAGAREEIVKRLHGGGSAP